MKDTKSAMQTVILGFTMLLSIAMGAEASETKTNTALQPLSSQRYSIPFDRGSTLRFKNANQVLNTVVVDAQGAAIHIIGRPDSADADGEIVSHKRATNIRNFLIRSGVSPSNITLEISSAPSEQANGNTFPSDVFVTRNTDKVPTVNQTVNPGSQKADPETIQLNHQVYPVVEFVATTLNAPRVIDSKVQSSPPLAKVESIQVSKTNASPTTVSVASPEPTVEPQWTLNEGMTLQQNLDVWAKDAGWNRVTWNSANSYRIKMGVSIKGPLTDALEKIAVSTGLNICTMPSEKYIRVSDAAEYCAKGK